VALIAIGAAAGDAIVQGRRAAQRFNDVRQLAGSFLFEFYDSISDLPGSTPARELVVRRALQYLDGLSRESSGDLDLKRELSEGYLRIGDVQGMYFESNLGRPEDARASYNKAIALVDEVVAKRPADDAARIDQYLAQLRISSLAQNGGDRKKAYEIPRSIAAGLERMERQRPLNDAGRMALAQAYFGIAEATLGMRRVDESLRARLRSVEIMRGLAAKHPDDLAVQRHFALTDKRLGYLYIVELHDLPKAAATMGEVAAIDQERLRRKPASLSAKMDLALDRSYLSAIAQRSGDIDGAIGLMRQTVAAYEELLSVDPENFRVKTLLVGDYIKLGGMLRKEGADKDAREVFSRGARVVDGLDLRNPEAAEAAARFKVAAGAA
jgi:non-specific serine/threonine protein kinase/serine/threonine-protein kinase